MQTIFGTPARRVWPDFLASDFGLLEIGFVLHNSLIISYVIIRRLYFFGRIAPDRKASELTSGVNSGVLRIAWYIVHSSWFMVHWPSTN